MLYYPFRNEDELFPEDENQCIKLYNEKREEIEIRKAQLMPFLKSTQNARMMHETDIKNDEEEEDEEIGLALDPDKEQEVADVEFEEDEDHPDYIHIAPDHLEEQQNEGEKKNAQNNRTSIRGRLT